MWCDMTWCDVIWCDVMWYGMIWHDLIRGLDSSRKIVSLLSRCCLVSGFRSVYTKVTTLLTALALVRCQETCCLLICTVILSRVCGEALQRGGLWRCLPLQGQGAGQARVRIPHTSAAIRRWHQRSCSDPGGFVTLITSEWLYTSVLDIQYYYEVRSIA